MGYESVQYKKQLEAGGDLREQLSVDEGKGRFISIPLKRSRMVRSLTVRALLVP